MIKTVPLQIVTIKNTFNNTFAGKSGHNIRPDANKIESGRIYLHRV